MRAIAPTLTLLLLGGCEQPAEQNLPARNDVAPAPRAVPSTSASTKRNAAPDKPLPEDRTALEEPTGPIDPKSAEAAGQVVQHYGVLIEQQRWAEANSYWGDRTAAIAFEQQLKRYPKVHLEIGKPSDPEGAAGSLYVTVPSAFYGKGKSGADFRRPATVTLRRVNDVPGSTAAQRRWHMERVEWSAT